MSFTERGDDIRIIAARIATRREGSFMRKLNNVELEAGLLDEYDFNKLKWVHGKAAVAKVQGQAFRVLADLIEQGKTVMGPAIISFSISE